MLYALADSLGVVDAGRHVVPFGEPGRRLADVAERRGARLIVVGSRGSEPRSDALVAGVSSRLAADAPCPVLVVARGLEQHVDPDAWPGGRSSAAWTALRRDGAPPITPPSSPLGSGAP